MQSSDVNMKTGQLGHNSTSITVKTSSLMLPYWIAIGGTQTTTYCTCSHERSHFVQPSSCQWKCFVSLLVYGTHCHSLYLFLSQIICCLLEFCSILCASEASSLPCVEGIKWLSLSFILSFCHSVTKKKLRWHELAPSRTSEHIRSFEDTPILLTCTCYWANLLSLAAILAVFLLSYYENQ